MHPVAPRPDVHLDVGLVAERVGVARDVEPVGGQALRVSGGRQQTIDHALVGVGPLVAQEGVELGQRRRQPRQVEGHAPQQRRAVRLRPRGQPGLLEPGQHEAIEGVARARPRRRRPAGRVSRASRTTNGPHRARLPRPSASGVGPRSARARASTRPGASARARPRWRCGTPARCARRPPVRRRRSHRDLPSPKRVGRAAGRPRAIRRPGRGTGSNGPRAAAGSGRRSRRAADDDPRSRRPLAVPTRRRRRGRRRPRAARYDSTRATRRQSRRIPKPAPCRPAWPARIRRRCAPALDHCAATSRSDQGQNVTRNPSDRLKPLPAIPMAPPEVTGSR